MPDKPGDFDLEASIAKENKKASAPQYSASFLAFWSEWPRKTGKLAAWKSWQKQGIEEDASTVAVIMEDIRKRDSIGWFDTRAIEKIPHPATYLNGRRFEDEGIEDEVDFRERRNRPKKGRRRGKGTRSKPEEEPPSEPHDEWNAFAGRLWMEFNVQMVLQRGKDITVKMARDCREAAKVDMEIYRTTFAQEKQDQDDPMWRALAEAMGNEIIPQWMKICGFRHHIRTVKQLYGVDAAA